MVDFLIFCMATVGLTAILVDGKIFAPFRERLERRVHVQDEYQEANIARGGKGALRPATRRRTWSGFLLDILTCYQCCGFWSGLFCGLFLVTSRFFGISNWVDMLNMYSVGWKLMDSDSYLCIHLAAAFFWLMCGLAGSFLAVVYRMFVELIFEKTMLCRRTTPEPPPENFFNEEPVHNQSEHDA